MTDTSSSVAARVWDGFGRLDAVPADALLGLIGLYRSDDRPDKIDLGVGVFRNDDGATPVMRAVKSAEAHLLRDQSTKSYLGADGDIRFAELLAEVALGADIARSPRLCGVQTPGGTGALRLGAELLKRAAPDATVWIGEPTWPNHGPIVLAAGLKVAGHRFYDVAAATIDFAAMMEDLETAMPGDILLLHGCCHNPTGATLAPGQWATVADFCERKGVIPFIDLAYQGLGDGLDEDAAATRAMLAALPAALLAYSCDKNFGLYRDRVGALWVQSPRAETAPIVRGNMLALARSLWSMPPDHGAALVRIILDSRDLRTDWETELTAMRLRINGLRETVAARQPSLAFIGRQRGMFAMLPITPDDVAEMRARHGIYMAPNGRINIAGFTHENIPHFLASLGQVAP